MNLNDEIKSLQLLVDIAESHYEESYPSEDVPEAIEVVKAMIKQKKDFETLVDEIC